MSRAAVNDLIGQFQHTLAIFYEEVNRFTDQQWISGISFFQVPVKQAMHLLDCLEFYFAWKSHDGYPWGSRFGGGWWELKDEQLPDKDTLLMHSREIEAQIMAELSSLEDEELLKPLKQTYGWAKTRLGHYIYALRHTVHHHGQLAALASYHGHEGGSWDL